MARKTNRVLKATEEDIAKINPENKALIDDFLRFYKATDHSEATITVTKSNLYLFFCYVLKHIKNRHFAHIRRKDYINFQSYLLENELSPARIRAIRSSISSLSLYIEQNIIEEIDEELDVEEYELWKKWKNVINSIPAPKANVTREKTIMSEEDTQKLLDYLVSKKQYQKACVLSLALNSGCRKSELNQFKTHFFDKSNIIFDGALYITPTHIRTKGSGKLGKQLQKYTLVKDFDPYLKLWMEERERLNIDSEWLFVVKGENGWEQMPVTTLNSYARSFSNILGADFYWHSCRHNLCTKLCGLNFSAESIVSLFGWSSTEMVKIYNDSNEMDALAKYFKGGEIQRVEEKSLTDL